MKKNKDEIINKLRNELIESDSYIDELNAKLKAVNPEIFKKQIEDITSKNTELEECINSSRDKILSLENRITELITKDEISLSMISSLKEEISRLIKNIESKNSDIFVLQADVFNEQRLRADSEKKVKNLEIEVCHLNERINTVSRTKNEKFSNEIQVSKYKDEIEFLNNKNIYLSDELDKLMKKNIELVTLMNTLKNSKRQKKACILL